MNAKRELLSNQLSHSPTCSTGKRFLSFLIDAFLILLSSFLISMLSLKITKSTSTYQRISATVTSEVEYYDSFVKDSHLARFNEKGERLDSELFALENISKGVTRSYNENREEIRKDDKYKKFVLEDYIGEGKPDLTQFGKASFTEDDLAYFYTVYVPTNMKEFINLNDKNQEEYYYDLISSSFFNGAIKRSTVDGYPVLSIDVSYHVFYYLTQEYVDGDSAYERGKNYYKSISDSYIALLEDAENLLIQSEPYYTDHYLVYTKSKEDQARMINISLLLSILIAYIIFVPVCKLIFGFARTLGRFILHLGVDYSSNSRKIISEVIKDTLGCFGYLLLIVILYFFPPMNSTFSIFMMPFFGKMSLLIMIIIIAVIAIINYIVQPFSSDRLPLLEHFFKCPLKDLKGEEKIESVNYNPGRDY